MKPRPFTEDELTPWPDEVAPVGERENHALVVSVVVALAITLAAGAIALGFYYIFIR